MNLRMTAVLGLCLSACPRPAVPPPAAVEKPKPPDPCASDMSGTWLYASDPSWEYQARDDGGSVALWVTRRFTSDGGAAVASATPDAGAASIELRRSATGFLGEVHALGELPSGATCPMTFPVRVSACEPAALTLLAAADAVVGQGCETPARPRNPVMLEHKLTRADAGGMRESQ
jgi:hypothetical protein